MGQAGRLDCKLQDTSVPVPPANHFLGLESISEGHMLKYMSLWGRLTPLSKTVDSGW